MGHAHLTSTMIYLHITSVGKEGSIARINAMMAIIYCRSVEVGTVLFQ